MSIACVQNYLRGQFPNLLAEMKNGEVRFSAIDSAEETDDRGFIVNQHTPRTSNYLPCIWSVKTAEEAKIAGRTQASIVYEIKVAQSIDGIETVIAASDRAELKETIGGNAVTLELITPAINAGNIYWKILAARIDADYES